MKKEPNASFEKWPADFNAKVRLLTSKEGGRTTPAGIGYRPQIWFKTEGLSDTCTSGSWQKMDIEKLFPGNSAEIEIAILAKELCKNKLFIGLKFRLAEGSTQIGEGEILEIFNKELLAR